MYTVSPRPRIMGAQSPVRTEKQTGLSCPGMPFSHQLRTQQQQVSGASCTAFYQTHHVMRATSIVVKRKATLVRRPMYVEPPAGLKPATSGIETRRSDSIELRRQLLDAPPGIKPGFRVLQARVLPLDHGAWVLAWRRGIEPGRRTTLRRVSSFQCGRIDIGETFCNAD